MPEARLAKPETGPPRTVLVLKPSSFGDIVHTLPAVAWLKSVWPLARFTWLVNSEWSPLLAGNPDLADLIVFPRRELRGLAALPKFYRWQRSHLHGLRPDLALDFQGLLRSASIGWLGAPRAFYGLSDAREGSRLFYDGVAPGSPGAVHSVERYLALARFAVERLQPNTVLPTVLPRFPLPAGDADDLAFLGDSPDDFVLLHPFARGVGKSLTTAHIEEFCRQLAPRKVVLVGRRPAPATAVPINAIDRLDQTTLPHLIALIRRAAFVISVDSGPAHLAAALGRPMVAIHTWSDPRRVGPYHPDAWVWKTARLVRMRDLLTMPPAFFDAAPVGFTTADIAAVVALATSPSNFCA